MDSTKKRAATASHTASPALPTQAIERIASFLPTIESVQTFSQVSKAAYRATQPARTQIGALGLTGKVTVGDQHLYTRNDPSETRFYFPTKASGATENFPHVTRRPGGAHTPHVTDIATIPQAPMPDGLPSGNYPTRHRYDVQPDRRLSPVILPVSNGDKRTGTMAQVDPSSGLSPMHYVAPRYKAKVDAQQEVPGPGKPVTLTDRQTSVGGNPQSWPGKEVKFFTK